jgi:hypothetical protein
MTQKILYYLNKSLDYLLIEQKMSLNPVFHQYLDLKYRAYF